MAYARINFWISVFDVIWKNNEMEYVNKPESRDEISQQINDMES